MAISKNLIILFGIVFTILLYISSHAAIASREHYGERKEVIVGKGVAKDIIIGGYPVPRSSRPCTFANRCRRSAGFPMPTYRRPCTYGNHCHGRPPASP
ncbi:hypothetical protein LIER_18619 [Lithospermum erythrorhizon]|uniref:Uncharacterized protein n=1 Tax=Lithospermum erythrorhizon TaxID=34254 RepID=A0AAV3QH82_LITER